MTTSVLKISDITKATRFNLKPDADEKQAIAERLNILGIRKLTFTVIQAIEAIVFFHLFIL